MTDADDALPELTFARGDDDLHAVVRELVDALDRALDERDAAEEKCRRTALEHLSAEGQCMDEHVWGKELMLLREAADALAGVDLDAARYYARKLRGQLEREQPSHCMLAAHAVALAKALGETKRLHLESECRQKVTATAESWERIQERVNGPPRPTPSLVHLFHGCPTVPCPDCPDDDACCSVYSPDVEDEDGPEPETIPRMCHVEAARTRVVEAARAWRAVRQREPECEALIDAVDALAKAEGT